MALNPIAYTEKVVQSFLKYQLTAYPFSVPRLHEQMRRRLNLDAVRRIGRIGEHNTNFRS